IVSLGADVLTDVTPALAGFSALITDYSSLVYDVALIPLPTLFIAPDIAEYTRTRGFYGSYADVAGGGDAATWRDLLPMIDRLLGQDEERVRLADRAHSLSRSVHDFHDGRNTFRVLDEILRRIGKASP